MGYNTSDWPLARLLLITLWALQWILCDLLRCPSRRYQNDSSPPCGPQSVNVKLLPIVWRRYHLLLLSAQVACSRHLSSCHPCLSEHCSWLRSSQLAHRPSLGRAPCLPAALTYGATCLPFQPVLPEEPLSIHCSTPVISAIPPQLCDPNETV